MKTYIKHHFAAIITLLVLAATQAFAAETSLLSDYTPNGESFQYYVNTIDFQKQTFKAVLDLSSCQSNTTNENVLSIGNDLQDANGWGGSGIRTSPFRPTPSGTRAGPCRRRSCWG